jgi:hypothetical protein
MGEGALNSFFKWSHFLADLPSPAEASSQMTGHAEGFAQAENRCPLFRKML